MPVRRILGGGRTQGVSFWPFPNSFGWWWLVSSGFLTRTSCHKILQMVTGAWPEWVGSVNVFPLTKGEGVCLFSHSSWLSGPGWCQALVIPLFPEDSPLVSSIYCCSVTQSRPTLAIPWTAACQASLSFTISQSLLKLVSLESVMPSKHLIICRPLLLLPSVFPSIRIFSSDSTLHIRWPPNYLSFSISPYN